MFHQKLIHKAHAITGYQRINDITQASAQTCDKAIPAAFIQRTLNTKHTYWAQGCRNNNTDDKPFHQYIEDGYLLNPIHDCKDETFLRKYLYLAPFFFHRMRLLYNFAPY